MAKHKSEGNSLDLAGGVESLHAWAELSATMGSKLLEAFYVERLDAVLVQKSEDAEGVRYDFDEATRLGGAPLDVGDLVDRLRKAERELRELSVDAEVADRHRDAQRLLAKASGVALALSYIEEMTRG